MSAPLAAGARAQGDIAQLRADVETALSALGAHAALRRLPPVASAPADRAKIVLVGEVGTGKTSLINAILERPNLLPAKPTSTYIGIGSAGREEIRMHLHDGSVVTARLSDIDRWIDTARSDDSRVAHIEILLEEPWLAQLSLFDTPGVGGTDTAAAALTLDALEHATAMIFVCSAEAKISLTERCFLAEAASRIDHVVFVLSKVDLLDDLGEQNLRENEETIRTELRFPPDRFSGLRFLPFSAVLADEGARGDRQALVDSGFIPLRQQLEVIAAGHWHFAQLNEMRAIRSALSEAFRLLGQRRNALAEPSAAELDRLETRQRELRDRSDTSRLGLDKEMDTASDAVGRQLRRNIRRLRDTYQHRLAAASDEQIRDTETTLVEDLCALHRETDTNIRTYVSEIARRLMLDLPGAQAAADELTQRVPEPDEAPSDYLGQRPPTPKVPGEGLRGVDLFYAGTMMANSLHLGPAALPVGAAWYLLQRRSTRRASDLAALRAWALTSITDAAAEISADVDRGFKNATYFLRDAIDQAFRAALDENAEAMNALDAAATDVRGEQKRIENSESQITALLQRWRQQRIELDALSTAPSQTNGQPTENPQPT